MKQVAVDRLKATERRADKWTAAMGVQQTEIDALAALQPDVLTQMATDAIAPFFDSTLDARGSASPPVAGGCTASHRQPGR
jgi:hypothetical protein